MCESISAFTFEVIQSFMINGTRRMIYIGATGVLGMLMCLSTYFFDFREIYKEIDGEEDSQYEGQSST
jgi:hypothetical protein